MQLTLGRSLSWLDDHTAAVWAILEKGTIVICGGGGGIPTVYGEDGKLHGVECVIDKDRVAALLAQQLDADFFVMATDVPAVSVGWGTPSAKAIRRASPAAIGRFDFASGSMGPKVEAARDFAERTGKTAATGSEIFVWARASPPNRSNR